jgi:hypothetical protein
MDKALISNCKDFINNGNLDGLKLYYSELQNMEYDHTPNWQYIYSQLYIHSCLKKKKDIADWFTEIFPTFDLVSQIALRQIFPYGRHLLSSGK